MISSTMPSARYSCSGSPLILAKGSTAIDGLSASGSAGGSAAPTRALRALPSPRDPRVKPGEGRAREVAFKSRPIDPHWTGNVLERLIAHAFQGEVEAARSVFLNAHRDADTARLGQAFEPSRNVDAVAEDVALMDADPEFDAAVRKQRGIAFGYCRLQLGSAAKRSASTTLANSTKRPSPVVLTMRP
jgi:hypothetical protein